MILRLRLVTAIFQAKRHVLDTYPVIVLIVFIQPYFAINTRYLFLIAASHNRSKFMSPSIVLQSALDDFALAKIRFYNSSKNNSILSFGDL